MYWVSKSLQFLGLLIVPTALVAGLMAEHNAMWKELKLLFLGALIFIVGRFFEPAGDA